MLYLNILKNAVNCNKTTESPCMRVPALHVFFFYTSISAHQLKGLPAPATTAAAAAADPAESEEIPSAAASKAAARPTAGKHGFLIIFPAAGTLI